jgi:hypothetical protein
MCSEVLPPAAHTYNPPANGPHLVCNAANLNTIWARLGGNLNFSFYDVKRAEAAEEVGSDGSRSTQHVIAVVVEYAGDAVCVRVHVRAYLL